MDARPPTSMKTIRVQRRVTDFTLVRRQEAGVSRVDCAPLQLRSIFSTPIREFGNGSLPGHHGLQIDAYAASDSNPVFARTSRDVRDIGACHHRFGRNAPGVHARAAEQMAFDDGHRHPRFHQSLRQWRTGLAGAYDNRVEVRDTTQIQALPDVNDF